MGLVKCEYFPAACREGHAPGDSQGGGRSLPLSRRPRGFPAQAINKEIKIPRPLAAGILLKFPPQIASHYMLLLVAQRSFWKRWLGMLWLSSRANFAHSLIFKKY